MSSGGYFKGAATGCGSSIGAGYANEAGIGLPPNNVTIPKSLGNPVAGPLGLEKQTVQLFEELERLEKEIQALAAVLYPLTYEQKSECLANDCVPLQPGSSPIGQSIYEGTLKVGIFRKMIYQIRNSLEI